MDCGTLQARLAELLDGEAPDEIRRDAERHLAGCPACRRAEASYRAVVEALAGLPRIPAPAGLAARTIAAIQRGVPEAAGPARRRAPRPRPRTIPMPAPAPFAVWKVASIAAAALLAIGIGILAARPVRRAGSGTPIAEIAKKGDAEKRPLSEAAHATAPLARSSDKGLAARTVEPAPPGLSSPTFAARDPLVAALDAEKAAAPGGAAPMPESAPAPVAEPAPAEPVVAALPEKEQREDAPASPAPPPAEEAKRFSEEAEWYSKMGEGGQAQFHQGKVEMAAEPEALDKDRAGPPEVPADAPPVPGLAAVPAPAPAVLENGSDGPSTDLGAGGQGSAQAPEPQVAALDEADGAEEAKEEALLESQLPTARRPKGPGLKAAPRERGRRGLARKAKESAPAARMAAMGGGAVPQDPEAHWVVKPARNASADAKSVSESLVEIARALGGTVDAEPAARDDAGARREAARGARIEIRISRDGLDRLRQGLENEGFAVAASDGGRTVLASSAYSGAGGGAGAKGEAPAPPSAGKPAEAPAAAPPPAVAPVEAPRTAPPARTAAVAADSKAGETVLLRIWIPGP